MPIGGPATGSQAGDLSIGGSGFASFTSGTPATQASSAATIISTLTNAALSAFVIHEQVDASNHNRTLTPPTGVGLGYTTNGIPGVAPSSTNIALYVLGAGLLFGAVAIGLALAKR